MGSKLRAAIVERSFLDDARRAEMFALMSLCYERLDAQRFAADLAGKQRIIILIEKSTDRLVGFSTLRVDEETIDGRPALVVFSGDTVVHPDHWGAKTLQRCFLLFVLRLWLTHPRRRVFWLLVSKGYKTYLLLANYAGDSMPRYDVAPAPEVEAFLHDVALRRWPEAYVPAQGVLRWQGSHDRVKPQVAPIHDDLMQNPHIAFFARKNPGYVHGDELVCLAEARIDTLWRALLHLALVRLRGKPRPASRALAGTAASL